MSPHARCINARHRSESQTGLTIRADEEVNIQVLESADGRTAILNPNIWVDEERAIEAAVRIQDLRASKESISTW